MYKRAPAYFIIVSVVLIAFASMRIFQYPLPSTFIINIVIISAVARNIFQVEKDYLYYTIVYLFLTSGFIVRLFGY